MTQKGIITRLQNKRGFGFITASNDESIFFSKKCIEGPFDESTLIGQEVTYDIGSNHRGKCAQNIVLCSSICTERANNHTVTSNKIKDPQLIDLIKVNTTNFVHWVWYRTKIQVAKIGLAVACVFDVIANKLQAASKVLLNTKQPCWRKAD